MGPITDAHKIEYARNVMLAVQQKKSRFEMGFTYHNDWRGRVMVFEELIGPTAAIIDAPRGTDSPNIDNQVEPVGVLPHQIIWGKLIEKEDAIKALTDYQSPFVQSGAAAIVRGRDTVFASSLFANRLIGQDAGTSTAYDTTNKVVTAVVGSANGATAVGMRVKKIQRAKRFLRAFNIDLDQEELWGVLNAQGHEELYNDLLTINTDTRKMDYIADDAKKIVHNVAGVNFVSYESMTDFDANTYTGAIWCKSGMHYGDFDPLTTNIGPNPAKLFRPQVVLENWWGSSRSEDAKIIKLLNDKTAG